MFGPSRVVVLRQQADSQLVQIAMVANEQENGDCSQLQGTNEKESQLVQVTKGAKNEQENESG